MQQQIVVTIAIPEGTPDEIVECVMNGFGSFFFDYQYHAPEPAPITGKHERWPIGIRLIRTKQGGTTVRFGHNQVRLTATWERAIIGSMSRTFAVLSSFFERFAYVGGGVKELSTIARPE